MRQIVCAAIFSLGFVAGCGQAKDEARAPRTGAAPIAPDSGGETLPAPAAPPRMTAALPPGATYTVVPVFYGTNRLPTGTSAPNEYYGNQRSDLRLGVCEVSIPDDHDTGEVERPSIWKLEFREDPNKHVVVLNVQPCDGAAFVHRLRETVQAADDQDAFIFIHGYNVTFADGIRRTAQIAHDLKFRGAPILYSWPARGEIAEYFRDENTALWAETRAAEFPEAIARASGARRIHLIAHSMGNRILAGALENLSQSPHRQDFPLFNEVVLTAPDLDAATFKRDIAPRILPTADRFTIYASENDLALSASKFAHGEPRLGQGGPHLMTFSEFRTLDMVEDSEVDTSLFSLGHSYYGSNVTVLDDLRLVLRGSKPGERGLAGEANRGFWKLLAGIRQTAGLERTARR